MTEAETGDTDVIVAFISSVIPSHPRDTELVFSKNHPDFAASGLIKESVFKMQKLATLNKVIFTGQLGQISDTLMSDLEIKLKKALHLS